MVKFKFSICSHSYTAGMLHERLRLYIENLFGLSISSGTAADELRTLNQIFSMEGENEVKILKIFKNFKK